MPNPSSAKRDLLLDPRNIYVSVTALISILGFVFWLSKVHSTTIQNEKELSAIRTYIREVDSKTSDKLNQMNLNMTMINRSLGSIEGKLEMIVEQKKL